MRSLIAVIIAEVLLSGCAKIEVHRALPDGDEREGIPFYLQRPYVVVQKSFPVEGEQGYLTGTVDPKAGTIEFRGLSDELSKRIGLERKMPLSSIRKPAQAPGRTLSGPDKTTAPAPPPAETSKKETTEKATTEASGIAKWDASVPNSLEINELFKIVFLPDLDEKYVIDSSAGMGTANLSVAMGPGGVINQFQVNLDNHEIGKFVMESAQTAVSLAQEAAKLGIGTLFAAPVDFGRSTSVVVKYIYVGYGMPGIYPILKNSEYSGTIPPETKDPYLRQAEWPYTRFSMKVKKELVLVAQDLATQSGRGNEKEEPSTLAGAAIKDIEARLSKIPPVPIKQLDDVNAKFDKIVEDRTEIVFMIPRPQHDKFKNLSEAERQTIKENLFAAVQKQVGDENVKFLTDNKYAIALRPE